MYAASTNYVQVSSSNIAVVGTPATGDVRILSGKFKDATNSSMSYADGALPNRITISVSVAPEILELPDERTQPLPRPREKHFQAPLREISAPWNAKWRLTQQRPRDGLR